MDRSGKGHKSSKRHRDDREEYHRSRDDREEYHRSRDDREEYHRSRDDRDDDLYRSRGRDSDLHHHHHSKSEKDSNRDRDRRLRHHHSKSSSSRDEERETEGSRDRERSSDPPSKLRERSLEERDVIYRDGESAVVTDHEGRRKRKGREADEADNETDGNDGVRVDREREKKRERRRFGEKVKVEEGEYNEIDLVSARTNELSGSEGQCKEFPNGNGICNGNSFQGNDSSFDPISYTSGIEPDTSFQLRSTKVSSISNTNENRGVSVTRSHEVPGNSSTDGTSSNAGKSGTLSLDALAKAKKALQMQKELSEKLKKLPQLNKGSGASGEGSNDHSVGAKVPIAVATSAALASNSMANISVTSVAGIPDLSSIPNYEAVKRAQELAAKMGFRQDPQFAPLINLFPGQIPQEISIPQKPKRPPVLRVDALGREIDEQGNVVNVTKPSNLSTLKVNINKQKKEAFQILKPEIDMNPDSNPFFDPLMGVNKTKILRPKRSTFQFVEEGKWSKDAEIMKIKNQFGEEQVRDMRARQALHAKAKLAPDFNPNLIEISERIITKEKPKDPIPEIEWWDVPLLPSGSYSGIDDFVVVDHIKLDKMTIYVEHPRPIEPPAEPAPPPPQPLKLTRKEQKKLRTQRRLARENDKQEMIRQGLIEPPKPKVKMSNLMKVLGSEATQDPTRLEMEIRSAAAEREQAHIDRNIARKLTPAERREKKEKKLFDDPNTLATTVSVYKINYLSDKKTRFKVDVNAHENRLSGCCVITDGITIVVVEGGSKSIKRYGKLMLRRINWADAVKDEDEDEKEDHPPNKCLLVWQGSVAKPFFHKFNIHECLTEAAARKIFFDAGAGHYWDLAVNFTEADLS